MMTKYKTWRSFYRFIVSLIMSLVIIMTLVSVNSHAVIAAADHTHCNWTYSLDNSILTATCGSTTGTCELTNKQVSFTFQATDSLYVSNSISKTDVLGSIDFSEFNATTGKSLSLNNIKFYSLDDNGKISGSAKDSLSIAGEYAAVLLEKSNTDIYPVYNENDLKDVASKTYCVLMNDIVLTDNSWTAINLNSGCTLDGQGHTIYMGSQSVALFQKVSGTIKNLKVNGVINSSSTETRAIVSNLADGATFENITVSGSFQNYSVSDGIGALMGSMDDDCTESITIRYCTNNASITTDKSKVGGIAGLLITSGVIEYCINNASITGTSYVGGIVGDSIAILSNCYNYGNIAATYNAGGIIGQAGVNSNVSYCYNGGNVIGEKISIGGIVGRFNRIGSNENDGYIKYCTNTGTIQSKPGEYASTVKSYQYFVGGIVGYGKTIEVKYCKSTPTVYYGDNKSTSIYGTDSGTTTNGIIAGSDSGLFKSETISEAFSNNETSATAILKADAVYACEMKFMPMLTSEFTVLPHTHSLSYSANGAKLTATCNSSNGVCGIPREDRKIELMLMSDSPTYSGEGNMVGWKYGVEIAFSLNGQSTWESAFGEASLPIIYYEGILPTTYSKSAMKPTAAGTYRATITKDNATAFVNFYIVKVHTVSFDANGGSGSMTTTEENEGQYTLPSCRFKPLRNMEFDGWSLTRNGPKADNQINLITNIILYARWKNHEHQFTTVSVSDEMTKVSCDCGFYIIKYD